MISEGCVALFRLEWCNVKSLPKANWFAEDYSGFSQMMLFLHGQYFQQKTLESSTLLSVVLIQLKQMISQRR